MDKVYKRDKNDTIQAKILRELNASVKVIYDAHEIWFYNSATSQFEFYKNKGGIKSLLEKFFETKGINLKCVAADMTAKPIQYKFADPKDEFLFNLKF
jgi:hypothetical protein